MIFLKNKSIIFFLIMLFYSIIPFEEARILLIKLQEFFAENMQEIDHEKVIFTIKGLIYFSSYLLSLSDLLIRIGVLSAVTFFLITVIVEPKKKISYKQIVFVFLAIELSLFFIKTFYILGIYMYPQNMGAISQYLGIKFPIILLFDWDIKSEVYYKLLSLITLETGSLLILVGFYVKLLFNYRIFDVVVISLFNFFVFVLYEFLNPLENYLFNNGN